MLTNSDINKLKQAFATKDDFKRFATKNYLKRFATKKDLKRFATKDDLRRFATKEDLKRFATKDDLQNTTEGILDLTSAFRKELKENIEKMRNEFRLIKNDLVAFKDEILHEIVNLRDDMIASHS